MSSSQLRSNVNPAIDALREWLGDKPFEWGSALALRTAIRAFPWVFTERTPQDWTVRYALPIFHALFLAWSTHTKPIKGHKLSAELSINLLYPAALSHGSAAYFASAMRAIAMAIASKQKAPRVDHSIRSIVASISLVAGKTSLDPPDTMLWSLLENDKRRLESQGQSRNLEVRRLLSSPVTSAAYQEEWFADLEGSLDRLVAIDGSFDIWAFWLKRIVSGDFLNFFDAEEYVDSPTRDRQAATSIIKTVDPTFWERVPSLVNRDIAAWIESARAGVLGDQSDTASVPPQNENVISFEANDQGKIALTARTYYASVRLDQDTLDRFNECLMAASDLLHRCRGSNAASRLVTMLENYIQAAGSDISEIRPSLLVQRGERLRQELTAYLATDSMLPPVADDILLDLRAWQAAHNMLVGLDPALMARDTAQLGPDVRVANVPPREIREIARDADDRGILAENVLDVIVEAAELAPASPDPSNRRTIWSFETGRNLIIEAFNVALRHPGKTTTGAIVGGAVLGTAGVAGAIVAAAAGALPAAKFLLSHRPWIETRLGDSPTWRALFQSLCDWLKENTPLDEGRE